MTGFLPSKWVLLLIAALIVACCYLYLTNKVTVANSKTLQVELNEANQRVAAQKTTIDLLQRDAKVQAELMAKYQVSVSDIRKIAADNLADIASTNYGAQANSNAAELEHSVNERMQMLFNSITKLSE